MLMSKRRAVPVSWTLVLTLVIASILALGQAQPTQQESTSNRIKYLLSLKRQGKQVEHFLKELNELMNELKIKEAEIRAQLPPEFIDPMAPLEKRARSPECYMAAGLSRSCDYKDLIAAVEERDFWNSVNSPGKRRRRGVESGKLTAKFEEIRNTNERLTKMKEAATAAAVAPAIHH